MKDDCHRSLISKGVKSGRSWNCFFTKCITWKTNVETLKCSIETWPIKQSGFKWAKQESGITQNQPIIAVLEIWFYPKKRTRRGGDLNASILLRYWNWRDAARKSRQFVAREEQEKREKTVFLSRSVKAFNHHSKCSLMMRKVKD